MNNLKRVMLIIGVIVFGVVTGFLSNEVFEKTRGKSVSIYVGNPKELIDYDLQAAVNYLSYRLEQSGLQVRTVSYSGDLYSKQSGKSDINIFIRGFQPFYDVRFNEKAENIFYIHRRLDLYRSELEGFDKVLLSQKKDFDGLSRVMTSVFFESGAVPHEQLSENYKHDVLYIYEAKDASFEEYIKKKYQSKVYSGIKYAELSKKDKELLLKQAKVVVYNMITNKYGVDYDEEFVPFAVYDIMSYGRPVVTNYRKKLFDEYSGLVLGFENNLEDKVKVLKKMLETSDKTRERMASLARNILLERMAKIKKDTFLRK